MPDPLDTASERPSSGLFRTRSTPSLGRILHAGFFQLKNGPFNLELRRHDRFSLVYLLGGAGFYTDANGVSRRLRPGDLFFTFPDLPCAYGPAKDESWREIFILFDGPVFDLWREQEILSPARSFFHLHPMRYWERKIRDIIEWPISSHDRNALWQTCSLQKLLAEILVNSHSSSRTNKRFVLKHQKRTGEWAHFAARILEGGRVG